MMTLAQRMRLEHIARGHAWAPQPTVEDIRILLEENASLEFALECALETAAEEAFRQSLRRRPSC
jgi:hypothetical protein